MYKLAKKDYGALLTKEEGDPAVVTNAWAFTEHVGLSLSSGNSQGDTLIIKGGWVELEIPIAELEVEEVIPPADDPVAFMDAVGAAFSLD